MSWNGYTDKILAAGLKSAVIYGKKGGLWGASGNPAITAQEVTTIVNGFSNPNGLRATNAKVGGVKYIVLQITENAIYGKQGTNGFCATLTNQCVIVGFYDKTLQPGKANIAVENMGDYLRENNY
eukprot:NODE_6627_length_498_cov_41.574610_g5842_i0.p1 GENE.NODE_6627_length_498_cov_41.574610_g5842_i0~~NODE_6627_length_498_cov_41.574610_g5842_i0.p1  ORF type:complete len:140 (-),score=2.80 NODE_6627_length_498_cov_41.574610_g5842_i0:77-451(-)